MADQSTSPEPAEGGTVPEDLYNLALDSLPGLPDDVISGSTQDEIHAALAAVLPEHEQRVRAQVAAEIRETARRLREDEQISQDGWRGYVAAAYIARGEAR